MNLPDREEATMLKEILPKETQEYVERLDVWNATYYAKNLICVKEK